MLGTELPADLLRTADGAVVILLCGTTANAVDGGSRERHTRTAAVPKRIHRTTDWTGGSNAYIAFTAAWAPRSADLDGPMKLLYV